MPRAPGDSKDALRGGQLALSAFWMLYMGGAGIFFPFFTLFLSRDAGLRPTEVGLVVATLPLVGLVAPPLWGRAVDRSRRPALVLALAATGAAAGQIAIGQASGFLALLAATAITAIFAMAVVPVGVAVSLSALGERGSFRFGRVRVWGTVGFLVTVVAVPLLTRTDGGGGGPLAALFPVSAALGLLAAAVALAVPKASPLSPRPAAKDGTRSLRHNRPFLRMLAFSFCAYLFLHGPMSLFPLWVREHGGGVEAVSAMWVLMLLPEIPLVALSGRWLEHFGGRTLLFAGVLAGAVRWIVCGLVDSEVILYAVQTLHGLLVTGLMVGSPLYLDSVVPERERATAQGFLSTAGIGLGGIASSIATGWLVERHGADAVYLAGGLGALLLCIAFPFLLPRSARATHEVARKAG